MTRASLGNHQEKFDLVERGGDQHQLKGLGQRLESHGTGRRLFLGRIDNDRSIVGITHHTVDGDAAHRRAVLALPQ